MDSLFKILDLAFALNTPSVMSATDLSNAVDFIFHITERLTIGPSNALVTAVTYSRSVTQHFNLTVYSSKEAVLSALSTMKSANRSFEESNSNEVLDFIRTRGFSNSRTTSTKLVVLIMVKGPTGTTQTKWAAEDLFNLYNNAIITVGLDSLTDNDKSLLQYIAKDDSRTFYVSDFKYSCHIVPNITILIGMYKDTVAAASYCSKYHSLNGYVKEHRTSIIPCLGMLYDKISSYQDMHVSIKTFYSSRSLLNSKVSLLNLFSLTPSTAQNS